jgi:hypothetical protein
VTVLAVAASVVAVRLDQYPTSGLLDWIGPLVSSIATAIGQMTPAVLAFALALYLWWRGVRLGAQTATFTEVESAFRWGIARLVVFGLIAAMTARPGLLLGLEAQTTPAVVGFFFVSLLTLALGRLESLRTRTRTLSVNSQWLGVLVLVAAAVVLVALLAGQLLSFDLLLLATRPVFDLLGQVLVLLIYAIVIPLAYVVEWVVYLVLSLLRSGSNQQPPQPPQPADIDNLLQRFFSEQVPPELLLALKAAGAAIVLGIALVIVARSLSRWRPSNADADATNEERDSLWDARRVRGLLLAWLRRLLGRHRLTPPAIADRTPPVPSAADAPQLASIRELYARLLRLGEAAGAYRSPATTPLEHAPVLCQSLAPEATVADLTAAYVWARYAEAEPGPDEATELREALERVHAKGAPD